MRDSLPSLQADLTPPGESTTASQGAAAGPLDGKIAGGWGTVAAAWIVTIVLLLAYAGVVTLRLRRAGREKRP